MEPLFQEATIIPVGVNDDPIGGNNLLTEAGKNAMDSGLGQLVSPSTPPELQRNHIPVTLLNGQNQPSVPQQTGTDTLTGVPPHNALSSPTLEDLAGETQILPGDGDGDGDTDSDDSSYILQNSNKPASGADDPLDLNRDGKISALDVRKLVLLLRGNTDQTAPELSITLVNDTANAGGTNSDRITSDPTIAGTVTDSSQITRLRAGLDNTTLENFTNIRGILNPDGTFSLTPSRLQQINNNQPLSDGEHTLHLWVKDQWGNVTQEDISFTLDTTAPAITASLSNDSGSNNSDGITNNPEIEGTVSDSSQITSFKATFEGLQGEFTDVLEDLQPDGSFLFDAAKLALIAGQFEGLVDGEHTLTLIASDVAGNTSEEFTITFTVDKTAPDVPTLDLDPESDSEPVGDGETNLEIVTLIGQTSPNTTVSLVGTDKTTISDELGEFQFSDVALEVGDNSFTIQATDIAGNTIEATRSFRRVEDGDTTPPEAPIIDLISSSDTGTSDSDNLTNDSTPTLQIAAEAGSRVKLFQNGTEIGEITANELGLAEFVLNTLADGSYNFTATATDAAGNTSDLSSTLTVVIDINSPNTPTFDLDPTSDSDPDGDKQTTATIVTLVGQTTPGSQVTLVESDAVATANVTGGFQFTNVALALGANSFTVRATDAAGNTSETTETFTRIEGGDTTPPLPPVIDLVSSSDTGESNTDNLTNDSTPTLQLVTEGGSLVKLFRNGVEIGQATEDGSGLVEFTLDALANGTYEFTATATDIAGNTSNLSSPLSITVDVTAPTVSLGNLGIDLSSIEIDYSEAINDGAFDLDNYSLTDDSSQVVEITSIVKVSNTIVRLILSEALTVGTNYSLGIDSAIKDLAGNPLANNTTLSIATALPGIAGISPSDGTKMVSLTREVRVDFNTKIDPSTLTNDSFYLIANGNRIAGRIDISPTNLFLNFFYDETLPPSTEVRVVIDGNLIKTPDGVAIDADGDGIAGGIKTVDFTTLPITRIPGTDLFGYVYDSFNKNADGSNIPVVGATIRLDALPNVFAVTDENGFFRLEDVPAPEFAVHIDGGTAINAPEGTIYATVGKIFHSVPGQATQLNMNGVPFPIYLPPMAMGDIEELSPTEETEVGFGGAGLAQLEALFPEIDPEVWALVQVTFPPGSAQDAEGNPATQATIIPVAPNRLPAPLPPGVAPSLVISIQAGGEQGFSQAGGATNFDVPAPVVFPNLDGLAPGEKALIWSFNHDAGKWEVIGTGTVSEDGKTIQSDEGVGILAPGWHFVQPGGCGGSGGSPPMPPKPSDNEKVTEHDPVALNFITGEAATNFMTQMWTAPPENPNTPSLPPIPGCGVPQHNPDDDNQQPFINVTIEVDGPLQEFMKPIMGGLPLTSQAFTLSPGTGEMKKFGLETKTYDELFGAGKFMHQMRDQLYGAQIKITVIEQKTDGTRTRDIYTYYQDRWVDVIDANQAKNKTGNTAAFLRTLTDGVVREKNVDVHLPSSVNTTFKTAGASPFDLSAAAPSSGSVIWQFDPSAAGQLTNNYSIEVNDPKKGQLKVGEIVAKGQATAPSTVALNKTSFETLFTELIQGLKKVIVPGADQKPGMAGIDDDGNGTIDDLTEYGKAGSDDSEQIVYDIFNASGTPAAVKGNSLTTVMIGGNNKDVINPTAVNFINQINGGLFVASNRFKTEFATLLPGQNPTAALIGTTATNQFNALLAEVQKDFQDVSSAIKINNSNAGNVTVTWKDSFNGSNSPTYGGADRYDYSIAAMQAVIGTPGRMNPVTGNTFNLPISDAAQQWALADLLNDMVNNTANFGLGINISWTDAGTSFAQFLANTVSHEIGHTYGLNEGYITPVPANAPGTAQCNAQGNCFPFDIMRLGINSDPDLSFAADTLELLKASMGVQPNGDKPIPKGLKLWRDNFNLNLNLLNVNGLREVLPGPVPLTPEIKLSQDSSQFFGFGNETATFGTVAADGVGNQNLTVTYQVTNFGTAPLTISSISFQNGNKGFSLLNANSLAGVTLAPNESRTLSVRFDPTVVGNSEDILRINSNADMVPAFQIALSGQGIAATPTANLTLVKNNNLGGVNVANGTAQVTDIAKITNDGTQPLVISNIRLVEGSDTFTLLDATTTPISLNFGESFSFGDLRFNPNQVGLDRAVIEVVTNDPTNPIIRLGAVGTGLDTVVYPEWGKDFIAIELPNLPSAPILRLTSDEQGNFQTVLPPSQSYHMVVFDPVTGLISHSYGNTPPSGRGIDLTASLVFNASTAADTDGDGLADDIEFAIGTAANKVDTDGDGLRDLTEIEQGLDPFGGQGFPTGIIASLPLFGEAKAVVVEGSTDINREQLAYVATGSHGLAIVDASQFNNPVVLGQLNLSGDATDVAVDTILEIAAVATNSGGLQLVDVSDPMQPTLIQTVNINATKVEISDGIAYVTVGNTLRAIDLLSGQELQNLTMPGSGTVTDLAREGSRLYAYTSGSDTFATIDISNAGSASILGQLTVSIASSDVGIGVGNGVAYLAGSGISTVNISNPSNPTLISGADNFFTARDIALNGSGLGLVASEGQGLALYSLSDPQNTNNFITVFDTSGFTFEAAIASGIAYVADGSGGLQVINYRSFDNQGQAPTLNISAPGADLDPNEDGVQVLEGSSVPIRIDVTDDVQVRNVELLVNGQVVSNDVSFPFDLSAIALPTLGNSVTVQVRATDTGGNTSLSNLLTFDVVPDTFGPTVTTTTPTEDTRRRQISGISVRFNEAIDGDLLNLSGMTLTNLGADGILGGNDDTVVAIQGFQLSETGRTLFITPPAEADFISGNYQLLLDTSIISDRAGNALAEDFTLNFTKRNISDSLILGETISDTIFEGGENQVFTFSADAGDRIYFDGISTSNFNLFARLLSPSGVSLFSSQGISSDRAPLSLIETGTYQLIIEGFSNATGDYSFRLLDAEARELAPDTDIEGTLDPGTLTNVFTFEGSANQRLFFDELEDNFFNISYNLYGPANQFINSGSFDREINLTGAGTYTLVIQGFSTESLDYGFRLVTPDTTTEALTLGATVNGNFDDRGDRTIYTFTGTAGQRLLFDGLDDDTSGISARLFSPFGNNVFLFSTLTTSDSNPFSLIEGGTYQLIVEGFGNIGDYSFRLLDLGDAEDLTLDTTISRTLDPQRETDVFKFEGSANQQLFFDRLGNTFNSFYNLYGPGNQNLTFISSDHNITLPGDGTYFLTVRNNSFGNSPVDYSFRLVNPQSISTPLTLGETINGMSDEIGETDIYTFTGAVGQRLYFDGLDNDAIANAQLFNPSGDQIALFGTSTQFDSSPFTLTEAGTYQLSIEGFDDTEDYSFRLLDLADAEDLTLDTTIARTLDPERETDIFTFEGTANQLLFLDDINDLFDVNYQIYGPNNQGISFERGDRDIILSANGTYILAIQSFNFDNTPLDYSFRLETPDIIDETLTLDSTVNGSIDNVGDQIRYTFEGTAGQRLIFDGLDSSSNSSARLFSPSGDNVGFFSSSSTSSDSNPFTFIETGTYELIIDGNGDTTGDFSFRLLDLANATTVSFDETIDDTLDPEREIDLYQIDLQAGQTILIDGLSSDFDGSFIIYGPNNQLIGSQQIDSDQEYTISGDGTYTLVVQGFNPDNIILNYSFQVSEVSFDDPGDPVGTDLILGETISSDISEVDEQDVYLLEATAGQRIYFDGLDNTFNFNVRLISPSGDDFFFFASNTSDDSSPTSLLETGTYQLIVSGNIGDYNFRFLDVADATDLALDTTIEETLDPGRSVQLFKFEGTEGQRLFLDGLTNQLNGSIVIYSANNQFIASVTLGDDRDFTLPHDGTYLLAVRGFSETPLDYSFRLIIPATINNPLTLGETVSDTLAEAGETDIYTFTGTIGQTLYFDGLDSTSGISAQLFNPSGNNIFFSTSTSSNSNPVTLTQAGTYQLRLRGNIGAYNFRLLDLTDAEDLAFDTVTNGTLNPGRETDVFKFTGTQGQRLFLDGLGTQFGGSFQLYGPNNQFVASSDIRFDFDATLPSDGTYFLVVEGFNNTPVTYSFEMVTPETSTTAITLGNTVNGNISERGETDIFTFTANAGQKLYFDGLTGNSNFDVSLRSPSGASLLNFFQDVNTNRAPITLIEGGTYQLTVDGSGATTGDYSFRILDTANAANLAFDTPVTETLNPGTSTTFYQFTGTKDQTLFLDGSGTTGSGTIVLYRPDGQAFTSQTIGFDREFILPGDGTYLLAVEGSNPSNNVSYSFQLNTPTFTTTALTLGETISSNIGEAGEEDFYTFEGIAGQRLYFDGILGNFNITAQLFSPSGQSLFSSGTNDDRAPFSLLESGTYRLRIDGNGATTGDYRFRLVDTATVPTLNFGATNEGSLNPGTTSQLFKFQGSANQTISLTDLGSQAFGGSYLLYGPGNQLIISRSFTQNFEVTLPGEGLYTLILDSSSNNAVNYRFRVV